MADMKLKVYKEFEELLSPLSEEAFKGLEEDILKTSGPTDPITVWRHKNKSVIVDGHHRYKICEKHNLRYPMRYEEFESKEDAMIWIIRRQKHRRNETKEKLDLLIRRLYEKLKKDHKSNLLQNQPSGSLGPGGGTDSNNDPTPTRTLVAEALGVGVRTVQRAVSTGNRLDKIKTTTGIDLETKRIKGEVKLPRTEIKRIADLPKEEMRTAVKQLMRPDVVKPVIRKKTELEKVWDETKAFRKKWVAFAQFQPLVDALDSIERVWERENALVQVSDGSQPCYG